MPRLGYPNFCVVLVTIARCLSLQSWLTPVLGWRLGAVRQCHTKESSGNVLMCLQSFLPSPLIWQCGLDTTSPPVPLWFLPTYILFPIWKQSRILELLSPLWQQNNGARPRWGVVTFSELMATCPEGLRVCGGIQERTLKCWVGKSQKLELRQKSC